MKNSFIPLDLIQIFPKDILSKVKILTVLFKSSSSLNIRDLISYGALDRKTIYKYIKEINNIAINQYGKDAIILDDKKQYFFEMSKIEFLTLRFLILETTFTIELINSFFKSSTVNTTKFCLENYISENALKKQVKSINSLITPFNIELKSRKGTLYLNGDETKIRYFLSTFFWRIYRGFKWPFVQIEKSRLKEYLSTIYANTYFNENKQEVPLFLLAISILRVKSKNFIEEESLPPYTNSFYNNFFTKSIKCLVTNYHLPKKEIKFIILFLHIFPEYILNNDNTDILRLLSIHKKDSYFSIVNFYDFASRKHENWQINSPEKQKFLSILISARIFVDIFNNIYFNIHELSLVYYSQKEFPNLLPTIESYLKKNEPNISKAELKSLTFKYSEAYVSAFPPQDFEPIIRILLVTDNPIYIETLLANRIKSVLSEKFNIIISNSSQTDNFDFIIATGIVEDSLLENKIIYVYPHLPIKDITNLLSICENELDKKAIAND